MRRLSSGRINLQQAHYCRAFWKVNLPLPGPKAKSTILLASHIYISQSVFQRDRPYGLEGFVWH